MGKDGDPCCHTCELFGTEPPVEENRAPVLTITEPKRLKILVAERGGAERVFVPTGADISVGRVKDNDIVLPHGTISKRQARFEFRGDQLLIVDLQSACGTVVDGKMITAPTALHEGATIHMGDFVLRVVTE